MTDRELAWCALAHDIYARNLPTRWQDRLFELRGHFIATGAVPTEAQWTECVRSVVFEANQERKRRERDEHERKERAARLAEEERLERARRKAVRVKREELRAKRNDIVQRRILRRRLLPPVDDLFAFYPRHEYADEFEIGRDTDHLLEQDATNVFLMIGMDNGYVSELR